MPGVEVKAALQKLLSDTFITPEGTGRLKHVDTQYPRPSGQISPDDTPKVVIVRRGHPPEKRTAGGRNTFPFGLKAVKWQMTLHVHSLIEDPQAGGSGDEWEQLLDDIQDTLRQSPDLSRLANTTATKVMLADSISEDTLPPVPGMELGFNSFITVEVEEWIQA